MIVYICQYWWCIFVKYFCEWGRISDKTNFNPRKLYRLYSKREAFNAVAIQFCLKMLQNEAANQLLLAIFRWSADNAPFALVSWSEQSSRQKFPKLSTQFTKYHPSLLSRLDMMREHFLALWNTKSFHLTNQSNNLPTSLISNNSSFNQL